MVAPSSLLRSISSSYQATFRRVRYEAPADLLPWADPYIASLFAGESNDSFPGRFDEDGDADSQLNWS
jgi:hypothetical protein